jgi:hypothetical protein
MPWLLDENSEELLNAAELLLGIPLELLNATLELLAAMLELLGLLPVVEDELGSSSSSTLEQEVIRAMLNMAERISDFVLCLFMGFSPFV